MSSKTELVIYPFQYIYTVTDICKKHLNRAGVEQQACNIITFFLLCYWQSYFCSYQITVSKD